MKGPRHVAVIPDGNRRWARARGLSAAAGHLSGIENIGRTAETAFEEGVGHLTIWWGSPANLERRTADEVRGIVASVAVFFDQVLPALRKERGVRFSMVGRWRDYAPSLRELVDAAVAVEVADHAPNLQLLFAYDGREEVAAAAGAAGCVGVDGITRNLWTARSGPVDLLIRTGGEPHLSAGFMMWSVADAVLRFPEELWPDYGPEALRRDLRAAAVQERRFGA